MLLQDISKVNSVLIIVSVGICVTVAGVSAPSAPVSSLHNSLRTRAVTPHRQQYITPNVLYKDIVDLIILSVTSKAKQNNKVKQNKHNKVTTEDLYVPEAVV